MEGTYLPSQAIELGIELRYGIGLHVVIEYKFAIYHCLKLNIATRSTSILKMSSLKYSVHDSSHGNQFMQ